MIGELSSALPFEGGYYACGTARHGKFLGISGSLALAGSVHFRYGDLSHAVCRVPHAHVPVFQENHRGVAVAVGRRDRLRAILNILGVKVVSLTSLWLFFALSAPFRGHFCAGAVQRFTRSPTL